MWVIYIYVSTTCHVIYFITHLWHTGQYPCNIRRWFIVNILRICCAFIVTILSCIYYQNFRHSWHWPISMQYSTLIYCKHMTYILCSFVAKLLWIIICHNIFMHTGQYTCCILCWICCKHNTCMLCSFGGLLIMYLLSMLTN